MGQFSLGALSTWFCSRTLAAEIVAGLLGQLYLIVIHQSQYSRTDLLSAKTVCHKS
jgi:hypothetical protein